MMFFGHDTSFWLATAGATVIRLLSMDHNGLSPREKLVRGFLGAFTAVFCAVVFTDPALEYLSLPAETWKTAMAAVLALTGEAIVRLLMNIIPRDAAGLIDLFKAWRGK